MISTKVLFGESLQIFPEVKVFGSAAAWIGWMPTDF